MELLGSKSDSYRWELWRQDDNGIRTLIASYEEKEAAWKALSEFESHHHKQTYWIEKKQV